MNIIHAVLLGIIQGLTEFLPISSSGHLVLFNKIFGLSELESSSQSMLLFSTLLHVGTLAAVFVVLWKDIWSILQKLIQPLTAYLIIATIPTVITALVFRKPLEKAFETGQFLGFAFLGTSALLIIAELLAKRAQYTIDITTNIDSTINRRSMSWRDALVVGVMQAIAVIPGISRSGATLSGALSRGLNRDFAARFSFLLSIPAILGATVFQLKDLITGDVAFVEAVSDSTVTGGNALGGIGAAAIIAGTLSATIVGFFAVRLMLKIVREKSLWGFAMYTGILGLLVLLDQFVIHLVF
jgi:undecaprenyl-diphosphatase